MRFPIDTLDLSEATTSKTRISYTNNLINIKNNTFFGKFGTGVKIVFNNF